MRLLPTTRGGTLWRALLACVLVMGFAAATTAVAGLLQVKSIVTDISAGATHINHLTLPQPGEPETLLLIGSDHRLGTPYAGSNTDTMMLVRLNDSSDTVNLLSIPRDLAVEDASGSWVKLNSIYSDQGGASGLLKVLQTQVFPGLQVNHVIDMNYEGFSDLVDAIGCVYTDVDHRYYNLTAPGPDNYSSIDIQPGYQKLCGGVYSNTGTNSALAFVRFRHTDSDKVRNARQQDFIRWARDNYSTGDLLANRDTLLTIFGKHVTVDSSLASEDGLLDLFDLVVNATKLTLKTIPFPENFGPCSATECNVYPCVTTATCTGSTDNPATLPQATAAEQAVYEEFMAATQAPATTTTTTTATTTGTTAARRPPSRHTAAAGHISLAGLTADPADGAAQAATLGLSGLPVYYPTYVVSGAEYCSGETGNCNDDDEPASVYAASYPRKYLIHGTGSSAYPAYVMTVMVNADEGWYYTVQGTTWRNAPILREPSRIVTVGGRRLVEYDDGGKVALVAWYTPTAVYWISNTLDNHIPNGEMLAIASSLTRTR